MLSLESLLSPPIRQCRQIIQTMESIISTFHIDWKIIIAQVINFAIVFVVLYIFALKPLSKLMKERSEKIAKGIDDAKTNAKLLDEIES